jgi:hypothetical protein
MAGRVAERLVIKAHAILRLDSLIAS